MKYIVQFTLPITCSCIVEVDNNEDAYYMVSNKTVEYIKKNHSEFSVDDDNIYDEDVCDMILGVEKYDEEI